MRRAIKLVLPYDKRIAETVRIYNQACNFVLREGFKLRTYKAEALGKIVEHVNPEHTSQTCSSCGQVRKANRKGVWYKCNNCGNILNSDLNAARNILALSKLFVQEADVNRPIVT